MSRKIGEGQRSRDGAGSHRAGTGSQGRGEAKQRARGARTGAHAARDIPSGAFFALPVGNGGLVLGRRLSATSTGHGVFILYSMATASHPDQTADVTELLMPPFVDSARTLLSGGASVLETKAPPVPRALVDGIVFAHPHGHAWKQAGIDLIPGQTVSMVRARQLLYPGIPLPTHRLAEIADAVEREGHWRAGDPDPRMVKRVDAALARQQAEAEGSAPSYKERMARMREQLATSKTAATTEPRRPRR